MARNITAQCWTPRNGQQVTLARALTLTLCRRLSSEGEAASYSETEPLILTTGTRMRVQDHWLDEINGQVFCALIFSWSDRSGTGRQYHVDDWCLVEEVIHRYRTAEGVQLSLVF